MNISATENSVSNCNLSFILYTDAGTTLYADPFSSSSDGSAYGPDDGMGTLQDASGNW